MPATREELEAAIDANPDQAENYLVLGDWLQERQDPRGELIALHHAKNGRAAIVERELGPARPKYGVMDWFYGFVRRLRTIIDEDDEALIHDTLDHPSLRHLQTLELELAGREDDDRQWLIEELASSPRPSLRVFSINSYWRGGNDPPAGDVDLTKLWAVVPRIARVTVAARYITPGDPHSETLTQLDFDGEIAIDQLAAVLGGSAPNLRELSLHDVDPGALALALEASKTSLPLTKLALPHATEEQQERIRARYACATFASPYDGDRYERLGE